MIYKKALISLTVLASLVSISGTAAANQQDITLTGAISAVSCEVVLNGGSSTLNVGTFPSNQFVANTQLGTTDLAISLNGCDAATAEDGVGALYVQGKTAHGTNNIFVSDINNTVGFMLTDNSKKTVVNNQAIPLSVKAGDNSYVMTAGMASTKTLPNNGLYSAPIVIAYVSD